MDVSSIAALLVDIDETITITRRPPSSDGTPSGEMFDTLREAAIRQGVIDAAEADRRIRVIRETVQWWRWSDFIVDLGLDPRGFWDYAAEVQAPFIRPAANDIGRALERLRAAGIYLYVTSNNPADGIRHKLRLAGLGTNHGSPLFAQCLGPPELKAMKADPLFWQRALAHIGFRPEEVAIVGDSLRDDYDVPRSVGIAGTFLLRHDGVFASSATDSLIHIRRFSEIADEFCGDASS